MCKSVRGAAFFGSSIHLALSFVFLCWFVFDTLISEININFWKCDPPEIKFRDVDPLAHYLNVLFKLLYFIALFVTGIYCFRGVERERPRTLKFAALAFVILQIIGVILFSIFFTIQWNTEPQASQDYILEPAQLSALESPPTATLQSTSNISETVINEQDKTDDNISSSPDTVTPMISENVLPVPDLNDTTTTTPTPALIGDLTTTSTVSPATTTTVSESRGPPTPCSTLDCPLSPKVTPPRRRLPHNQLVSLVLQMCFAVTNGVGSVVYVIVLALYMLKL